MTKREENLKKTMKSLERQVKEPNCPDCVKRMAELFGIKPTKKN